MKSKKEVFFSTILPIVLSLVITTISYCQLEVGNHALALQLPQYIFLNIGTIFIINMVLYILVRRWWIACLISGTCWTILSIANYWVVKYRWLPISTQDLYNLTTALEVSNSYKLTLNKGVILCVFGYICIVLILLFLLRLEKGKRTSWKKIGIQLSIIIIFSGIFLYKGYFAEKPIKPKHTVGWTWVEGYHKYGYMATSVEILLTSLNPVSKPDDYSDEVVRQIAETVSGGEEDILNANTPDIVLILNETLYDLSLLTDIKTDIPYLENINNMENTVQGYTLSINVGGGTNLSEYELLTSNSIKMMSGITPFNSLKLKGANSIVNYLKSMGYQTLAMHSSVSSNYSRARAYPALGFDYVRFIDDFTDVENYGNRFVTDECMYKNMHEVEQNMDSSRPHLLYGLTMQNHGSWDRNDDSFDIVHVQNDYGSYNNILNEYLTSIYLSDLAFKDLTEYYSKIEKPTIICMMGDHAPYFAEDIVDRSLTEEEKRIKLRSTPFVIWANFPIEEQNVGTISMIYAVPTMLKTANMNLSPYYQYLMEMRDQVPIITSFDSYIDKKGVEHSYADETLYTDLLNKYFYMEYNNASGKGGRVEELFIP